MTISMGRWTRIGLFLAAVTLFSVANRGAYEGYFLSDDLNQLGWPTFIGNDAYYHEILTPRLSEDNFRAVGYLYYRFMGRTFKMWYPPYVVVLQTFHLVNVILVFLLLRSLGLPDYGAAAGALFYLFHAAVLWAYWLPSYVFDVLCCTLSLVTVLLYIRGRWLLALIPFWLAYKSKEIAVTLPAALLAWEWFLGERRWKRLIPFFLISLNFGLQAIWHNHNMPAASDYVLRFTPAILWHSIVFYSSAIFFVPLAGLALLLLPIFVRDRRIYVGLVFMIALLVPMLILPSRQETVYWYIPLVGVAIVVGVIASRAPKWAIVLFFVLWFPLNYAVLREKRRALLTIANEHRWYMTGLFQYAGTVPQLKAVVYEGIPEHMRAYGVEAAIHLAFGSTVDTAWYKDGPKAERVMTELPMAVVDYSPVPHIVKGTLRTR